MIDSDSPNTIFPQADLRELLKVDVTFARPMPKNEQYVEYNNKPLNLLGYSTVNVKVGKKNNQECPSFHHKRRQAILDRTILAQPTQLQSGAGEVDGNSEYADTVHMISERQDTEILGKVSKSV